MNEQSSAKFTHCIEPLTSSSVCVFLIAYLNCRHWYSDGFRLSRYKIQSRISGRLRFYITRARRGWRTTIHFHCQSSNSVALFSLCAVHMVGLFTKIPCDRHFILTKTMETRSCSYGESNRPTMDDFLIRNIN